MIYKFIGSATLSGNILTLTGPGKVHLGSYQSGDAHYLAAPEVRQAFTVQ